MEATDHKSKRIDISNIKGKLHLTQEPSDYFQPEDSDDLNRFLKALCRNENIHYVLMERRFIRNLPIKLFPDVYSSILHAIAQIPNLKELEIWSGRVPLTVLCQALASAQNLIRLGLGMVTLVVDKKWDGELHDIGLHDNAAAVAASVELDCSGLARHPNLQVFYLSDFRTLINCAADSGSSENTEFVAAESQHLQQQHGQHGDDPMEEQSCNHTNTLDPLWEALATCPNLQNIELFSNQETVIPWSPHGLSQLATCPNLDHLTLRRLGLTSADIIPFSQRLSTTRRKNEDMSSQSEMNSSNVRLLNVQQNKLGDEGCIAIARAVSTGNSIRELDLRNNRLSSEGSLVLIPLLTSAAKGSHNPSQAISLLEKLNIASNPIGDEGACLLAEALEEQQDEAVGLKHLDLGRSNLSDVGCTRLAKALLVNKTLLSLNLGYNNITNQTYLVFGEALQKSNRTLLSLNLQVNPTKVELSGCSALLRMVEENYVLETLSTSLGSYRGLDRNKPAHAYYIRIFLRLNHAGRRKLLEQRGSKLDWINALLAVQDSLNATYYLVSTNPSLCQRSAECLK